jgi:hypothetical protein
VGEEATGGRGMPQPFVLATRVLLFCGVKSVCLALGSHRTVCVAHIAQAVEWENDPHTLAAFDITVVVLYNVDLICSVYHVDGLDSLSR